MTAQKHPWESAARGSWPGTPLATPNTGCLEPTWSSWSRHRPPSSSKRRAKRQGRWCSVEGRSTSPTGGVGGKHPLDVPVFVLGGSVPQEWVYEGSPFTFVTNGLESAVEQAKAVAG